MVSKIPGGGGEVRLDFKGMSKLLRSSEVRTELRVRMARVAAVFPDAIMQDRTSSRARVVVYRFKTDREEAETGDLARALLKAKGQRGIQVKTRKPK